MNLCDYCKEELGSNFITIKHKNVSFHPSCLKCCKCDNEIGGGIHFSYPSCKMYCIDCRIAKQQSKQQEKPHQVLKSEPKTGGCFLM